MDLLEETEKSMMKSDIPEFSVGDTVRVHVRVREGEKERVQVFAGTVIARRSGRNRSSFLVRKVSGGVGVERGFPLFSPVIKKIEVTKRGRVRRAKLYYLRHRTGKSSKITEKRAV